MFNKHRPLQFELFNKARRFFIDNFECLVQLEQYLSERVFNLLVENIDEIESDYNEASYLYPFWQQYPPDERGRKPRGDQYPWIEVGEHAIGDKLYRLLAREFKIRDVGLPAGCDKRFVLQGEKINELTKGFTSSAWLFIDIKSVGPRDDFDHTVMSHNQVSGSGIWTEIGVGMKNAIIAATGKRQRHKFHCSLSPLYILSNQVIAPAILIAVKPVYSMMSLQNLKGDGGQPLSKISVVTIPNGLLLAEKPGYLKKYPGLFFPGKDDKKKNPFKVRSRISFPILRQIAAWRVRSFSVKQS